MSAHATARRAELFDQLVALFLAEGFAHLTLDAIAARLRCSKSTLYTLADSKDALVEAATVHFFRDATDRVEAALDDVSQDRITAYLTAVGTALRPASEQFMADLDSLAPARAVYEKNTAIAARRVQQLISEDSDLPHRAAMFAGDVAASTMVRIQTRDVARRTGLSDADAYLELARLLTGTRA
jgi:AcrR family transcriptional regulator